MAELVLLTETTNSNVFEINDIVLVSLEERLAQYMSAIEVYIKSFRSVIGYIDDYQNRSIERVWYRVIKKNNIREKCFKRFYGLHGCIGRTDRKTYDKFKLEYFVCDILCLIGFFDSKKRKWGE